MSSASRASRHYASYLTVNISSPNTPGLRDHAGARAASPNCCRASSAARRGCSGRRKPPLFLKIAPDLRRGRTGGHRRRGAAKSGSTASSSPTRRSRGRRLRSTRACRRDRRAVGKAAVRALDHRAGQDAQAARAGVAHHRRRRRRFRRDGAGEDPRRRRSRAALHRHDLCRALRCRAASLPGMVALCRQGRAEIAARNARQPSSITGRPSRSRNAVRSLQPQHRQQAEAAHQQEDVQRRPQAVIAEGRRQASTARR